MVLWNEKDSTTNQIMSFLEYDGPLLCCRMTRRCGYLHPLISDFYFLFEINCTSGMNMEKFRCAKSFVDTCRHPTTILLQKNMADFCEHDYPPMTMKMAAAVSLESVWNIGNGMESLTLANVALYSNFLHILHAKPGNSIFGTNILNRAAIMRHCFQTKMAMWFDMKPSMNVNQIIVIVTMILISIVCITKNQLDVCEIFKDTRKDFNLNNNAVVCCANATQE